MKSLRGARSVQTDCDPLRPKIESRKDWKPWVPRKWMSSNHRISQCEAAEKLASV